MCKKRYNILQGLVSEEERMNLMKRPPLPSSISKSKSRLFLAGLLLASLAALWFGLPSTVLADSGGFPTPTRTPVPPTSTNTPTLVPSSTPTQGITPAAQVVNTATLVPAAPAIIGTAAPTTAPSGGAGALACLPLAIIFILAIVIGATWLLTRRSSEEVLP